MQEHCRDVDLHRTDLVAGAAEGRREGQRRGVLDADQLRYEDRADRSGVDRSVRVAAGAGVDRANVQASAAADAVERLPPDLVAKHARTAVIEQNDMELLRTVAGCNAGPE